MVSIFPFREANNWFGETQVIECKRLTRIERSRRPTPNGPPYYFTYPAASFSNKNHGVRSAQPD